MRIVGREIGEIGETMAPDADTILLVSCGGGIMFLLGLMSLLLSVIPFGRIAPHPRAFWAIPGIGLLIAGIGIFLFGVESIWLLPLVGATPTMPAHPADLYILLLGLFIVGLWAPWAYLQQILYNSREVVIAGKSVFKHERSRRLRRRNLAMAASLEGIATGSLVALTLASFSRTAPQGDLMPIVEALAVGCAVGIVAFGVALLAFHASYRRDLVAK